MSEERLVPKLRFNGFDEEWIKTNLGNISSNEMYGMNSAAKEYDGFNKYIRITDISETSNKFVPNPLTSPDGELEAKYQLQEGDLVFARTGASTGKTYLYDKNDGNLYFAGFLIKFHIDKAVPKFIFYNTLKEEYLNWVSVMSVRSGQPGINSTEYQKFPLYLPSLDEQNKISNFLSKIDEKIELLENKHQYYQDFKKYLMQQIFAQKLRFKINSSYTNYKLKDIVTKFSTGLNPRKNFKLNEGGENYYVTIKNFQNGILNLDDKCDKIDDNALKLINKRSDLQKDDLIFASIGRVGEVYLIKNNPLNWNINESVFSLRPNKQFIEPKFLYYLLNSNKIKNYFESNITGSTFKSIKMKDLKNTPVTIPDSFELQNEIVKLLSSVDSKIFFIENEFTDIKKFKKGLLQQMFVFLISSILFLIVYLFR